MFTLFERKMSAWMSSMFKCRTSALCYKQHADKHILKLTLTLYWLLIFLLNIYIYIHTTIRPHHKRLKQSGAHCSAYMLFHHWIHAHKMLNRHYTLISNSHWSIVCPVLNLLMADAESAYVRISEWVWVDGSFNCTSKARLACLWASACSWFPIAYSKWWITLRESSSLDISSLLCARVL